MTADTPDRSPRPAPAAPAHKTTGDPYLDAVHAVSENERGARTGRAEAQDEPETPRERPQPAPAASTPPAAPAGATPGATGSAAERPTAPQPRERPR